LHLGDSVYDISETCYGKVIDTLCNAETFHITAFLNSSTTRRVLHPDALPASYRPATVNLSADFTHWGDAFRKSTAELGAVLDCAFMCRDLRPHLRLGRRRGDGARARVMRSGRFLAREDAGLGGGRGARKKGVKLGGAEILRACTGPGIW
jgi:hypothetical protein